MGSVLWKRSRSESKKQSGWRSKEMSGDQGARGTVEAVLPRALYRVRLNDGAHVVASLSSHARSVTVKLMPGDSVVVQVSPYDPNKGRITKRL